MNSLENFDAVIMLTWSDWKAEPRSNRYHYATRFARTVPVLFLQHQYLKRNNLTIEPAEIPNIDIVNISIGLNDREIKEIKQLMQARGIRRPILWIYDSMNYQQLLDAMPKAFRVYHATEDYFTKSSEWNPSMEVVTKSVIRLLEQVDFMVACTEGVAHACLTLGKYHGPYAVIENGCDAEYFLEYAQRFDQASKVEKTPIAIFQGGINNRLDYPLIHALIEKMPTWEFRFCGNAIESKAWDRILKLPNVKYYGALKPEKFAELMCESTVGIITYIQDQWIYNSLPLKAYEYVACGLPVVTIPIAALELEPDLMTIAKTPDEFKNALLAVAKTRFDPLFLERRRNAALGKSYNIKFNSMCKFLLEATAARGAQKKRLKLAMLYDSVGSTHVTTIKQHLEAFEKYSNHSITYVPATSSFWNLPPEKVQCIVDFSHFDVVVIHYSVRLSIKDHLDEGLARTLEIYNGFKVLFIQDEYEGTEIARQWMDRLQFDLVYTCVPDSGREQVYPSYRFPSTDFLPTLTGYIPEESDIEKYAQPISERNLLIAYRGRKLPAIYGDLGYEKYRIGLEMKRLADELGIASDIEVDDSKRIYGTAWYQFLGSSRATLGTESGANIFDFDGSLNKAIAKLEKQNPDISYEEISAKVLAPHEGLVQMSQISPKVFEAICLRTALVLFEGHYSNVVQPDIHYIALKKDFSNAQEVIRKLQDTKFVEQITNRAYDDIVSSGKYSYHKFIASFDAEIEVRVLHDNQRIRLDPPLFFLASDGTPRQALPAMPSSLLIKNSSHTLKLADFNGVTCIGMGGIGLALNRALAEATIVRAGKVRVTALSYDEVEIPNKPSSPVLNIEKMWRLLPFVLRVKLVQKIGRMVKLNQSVSQPKSFVFQAARKVWRLLPLGTRIRLAQFLEIS